MAKKAAVLVVDPVNGAGLFHYLEAFFENGIPFRTFAVAETPQVNVVCQHVTVFLVYSFCNFQSVNFLCIVNQVVIHFSSIS